ncbi:MAG: Rieske (2Fe-2S) protein [Myxococcota bacterium]
MSDPAAGAWSLPRRIRAWYLAAASRDCRPGRVVPFDLAGERGVIARTDHGLSALGARCPHMGASLAQGHVDGGRIVCPLHHLGFDRSGRCSHPSVAPARAFAVAEHAGAVFVCPTDAEGLKVPGSWVAPDLVWRAGPPHQLALPWEALVANAFDLHHLGAVHRRALVEPPVVDQPDPDHLRLRYAARVTGRGLSDRVIAALAGDRVEVTVTSGGPTTTVEARLGGIRSALVIGFLPGDGTTTARGTFAVAPGPALAARIRVARWLYTSFLARDVAVLAGAAFDPRSGLPEDAVLQQLVAFLDSRVPA